MTRWWMGTSGESASQAKEKIVTQVSNGRITNYTIGEDNGDYYKLYAPSWNNSWTIDKMELSKEEEQSLQAFKREFQQ